MEKIEFLENPLRVRISIKNMNTGKNYKLTLERMDGGYRRWVLLVNDRKSKKYSVITLTELFEILRGWLKNW